MKIPNVTFGNKGSKFGIPTLIFTVVSVGVVLIIFGILYLRFFDVRTEVNEADVNRHAFTLANVLLSSEKLVYNDGNKLLRGVLDKDKLDNINNNQKILFDNLTYPASSTEVTIQDLDSDHIWTFTSNYNYILPGTSPDSTPKLETEMKTFQISFPIVIRFSENDVHIGKLTLKLTETSLA